MPGSREALKDFWSDLKKKHKRQLEGDPIGQRSDTLNIQPQITVKYSKISNMLKSLSPQQYCWPMYKVVMASIHPETGK